MFTINYERLLIAGGRRSRMRLVVTTWNINSVRLRINLVTKFLRAAQPDVICLQETKCPDDKFPLKRFARLGYVHAALNGQKGYHGVAILSRAAVRCDRYARAYCGKTDSRHIAVTFGERAGLARSYDAAQFLCPCGRRRARSRHQREIRPQARVP